MMSLKSIIKLTYFVGVFSVIISCSNDDDTSVNTISEQDAVEILEASLKTSSGGFNITSKNFSEALSTTITANEVCGTLYQDTYPFTHNGMYVEADYSINWFYELSCNMFNIPQIVELKTESNGSYTTQRMYSQDAAETGLTITGLSPTYSVFTYNGYLKREGQQTIVTNQLSKSINSTVGVDFIDLLVEKYNYSIVSGSAAFDIQVITNANSLSFVGTIVFEGNGIATVIVNGNSYTINLN